MTRQEKAQRLQESGLFRCEITANQWALFYLIDPQCYDEYLYRFYLGEDPGIDRYNKSFYWWGCFSLREWELEDVLENISPDVQEKLVFYLDVFLD